MATRSKFTGNESACEVSTRPSPTNFVAVTTACNIVAGQISQRARPLHCRQVGDLRGRRLGSVWTYGRGMLDRWRRRCGLACPQWTRVRLASNPSKIKQSAILKSDYSHTKVYVSLVTRSIRCFGTSSFPFFCAFSPSLGLAQTVADRTQRRETTDATNSARFCIVPVENGTPTETGVGSAWRISIVNFRVTGLPAIVFTPPNQGGQWTIDANRPPRSLYWPTSPFVA